MSCHAVSVRSIDRSDLIDAAGYGKTGLAKRVTFVSPEGRDVWIVGAITVLLEDARLSIRSDLASSLKERTHPMDRHGLKDL